MDIGLVDSRAKKWAKQYIGANYKGCTQREDANNVYLDIEFFKADKTVDKTTLTFPKNGGGAVDFGDLTKWDNDKAKTQVPNVNQTGQQISALDGRINMAFEDIRKVAFSSKEKITINFTVPKDYDIANDRLECFSAIDGVSITSIMGADFVLINKDTNTYEGFMYIENDRNVKLNHYNGDGDVTLITESFITHGERTERLVICDITTGHFGQNTSYEMAMLDEAKRYTKDKITIYIDPEVGYDYSNDTIAIRSEKNDEIVAISCKDFLPYHNNIKKYSVYLENDVYVWFKYWDKDWNVKLESGKYLTHGGRDNTEFTCNCKDSFVISPDSDCGIEEKLLTIDHEKLSNLMGSGGKGHYHLDEKQYRPLKNISIGLVQAQKIITGDYKDNNYSLVSTSGFETMFGNRVYGNTQFSSFRENLTHVFNNGEINRIDLNSGGIPIPMGDYIFDYVVPLEGEDTRSITKLHVSTFKGTKTVIKARISIMSEDGGILYENYPKGFVGELVDSMTGRISGEILLDVQDAINVTVHSHLKIEINLETDMGLVGRDETETLPYIALTIEKLQIHQIADIHHIYESNPNAISNKEMFELLDCNEDLVLNRVHVTKELISPFGKVIVPHNVGVKKVIWMQEYIPDDDGVMKEFIAESVECIEYTDSTRVQPVFEGLSALERIYLPNITEILTECFVKDCKILKELYVPKLGSIGSNFIENCPYITVYTNSDNVNFINYLKSNSINYRILDLPTLVSHKPLEVLRINEEGTCEWGAIPDHKHKFVDIIDITTTINDGDFHAINKTGPYRMTNAKLNLPNADYKAGDNDFIVKAAFVDESDKFGGIIAQDIRSTRCFIMNKNNGTWGGWREFVINSNNPWNSEGTNIDNIASVCEMAIKNATGVLPAGIGVINNVYVKNMIVNGLMRQKFYDMNSLKEFQRLKNVTWQAWVEK